MITKNIKEVIEKVKYDGLMVAEDGRFKITKKGEKILTQEHVQDLRNLWCGCTISIDKFNKLVELLFPGPEALYMPSVSKEKKPSETKLRQLFSGFNKIFIRIEEYANFLLMKIIQDGAFKFAYCGLCFISWMMTTPFNSSLDMLDRIGCSILYLLIGIIAFKVFD